MFPATLFFSLAGLPGEGWGEGARPNDAAGILSERPDA